MEDKVRVFSPRIVQGLFLLFVSLVLFFFPANEEMKYVLYALSSYAAAFGFLNLTFAL